MPGVFISHAFADRALVDPFVDDVIRLGCGVPPEQVFYSSGEDTGVPSGEDLNAYVRKQVADASIVVAVISPTFQTRPFCVAELGAAWAKVGNLFPIAVPGMGRTDLEGCWWGWWSSTSTTRRWAVAENAEDYGVEIPGTNLLIALTDPFPGAPSLVIFYSIEDEDYAVMEWFEIDESYPDEEAEDEGDDDE